MKKSLLSLSGLAAISACAMVPADPPTAANLPPVDIKDINDWTGSTPVAVQSFGQASPRQAGELRVPRGKGPFPVAMLIHGGCWNGLGSKANFVPLADWLAERGVASWNVSYRDLAHKGGWPASFEDWAGALAALKPLAAAHDLDLGRLTLIGHSAGTLPAVWLATGSQGDLALVRDLPKARASVVLDGPIDMAAGRQWDDMICGRPVIDELMGGTPDKVPARFDMVDPRKNPPVIQQLLVVDGALPSHDPALLDLLRSRGIATEVVKVSQEDHFSLLKPGTADFALFAPQLLKVVRGR